MALVVGGAALAALALRWAGEESQDTGIEWLPWPVAFALLAAYSAVIVVWLRHYLVVSQESEAWTAQRTSPPDIV
jgi:hypothetical protein